MAIANWDDIWGVNVKTQYDLLMGAQVKGQEVWQSSQALNLRAAETYQALTALMVSNATTLANRTANNAATIDSLAQLATLGVITASRGIDAEIVDKVSSVANSAVDAAVAAAATNASVANASLQTTVADLAAVVSKLLAAVGKDEPVKP